MIELKPCFNCGEEKELVLRKDYSIDRYYVCCNSCQTMGSYAHTDKNAKHKWNVGMISYKEKDNNYYAGKFDKGKTDWGLIPEICFRELVGWKTGKTYSYYELFWNVVNTFKINEVDALVGIRKILEHGAKKYGRESWKSLPDAQQRYFAAYMRHRFDSEGNELPENHIDKDSGLPSIHHALCNIVFLLWFEIQEDQKPAP